MDNKQYVAVMEATQVLELLDQLMDYVPAKDIMLADDVEFADLWEACNSALKQSLAQPAPTYDSERAAMVAKYGDCCGGGDPMCSGGCLVQKAIIKGEALAQPAQEPFAWMRFKDGKPDWSEDCLYTKPNSDDGYFEDPGYELKPIYLASQPQAPVVPEGWKFVPTKPTMSMIESAKVADDQRPFGIYTAMIAASKGKP